MQDINNVCEVVITHVKNYEVDIKLTREISFPWTQGITHLRHYPPKQLPTSSQNICMFFREIKQRHQSYRIWS
jgi:hypothetical protein